MENNVSVPILIPFEPEEFWAQIRLIIREEVSKNKKEQPLFKMQEICSLFKVTKPTIYDWIKHGKLKKVKIRSRVFFLGSDIRQLMQA